MQTTVTGFFVDPTNNENTITTPASFEDFVIGDQVLINRGDKIITRATVVDTITRESNGEKHLVLTGVNRRTVKPEDTIESLHNSPRRFNGSV